MRADRTFGIVFFVLSAALFFVLASCESEKYKSVQQPVDPFGIPIDFVETQQDLLDNADVLVDQWGIPHIFTRNDHDAWFMQGYLAAKDRFFQMDMARRLGNGNIGELIGTIPVIGELAADLVISKVDFYYRSLFTGRDGRPVADAILDNLDSETISILQAYAEGVNAILYDMINGRYGITLPPTYQGLVNVDASMIRPWSVRDTLSILIVSMYTASNSYDSELAMGEALASLGPEKFADFFRAAPENPTTVLPNGVSDITPSSFAPPNALTALDALADWLGPAVPAIRSARNSALDARTDFAEPSKHSNNWAVDADHSATGHALIANDPHLSPLNPPYFWLCHIDSKMLGNGEVAFAGLSFPGAPGVQIGHNDFVGWAGTAANYDTIDAYIEQLDSNDPNAVVFEGKTIKMTLIDEEFHKNLNDYSDVAHKTIQVAPHHGPIVPKSCENGYCVSVRWTGAEPGSEIKAFLDILVAKDMKQGLDAFSQYRRGPYNWIVADSKGQIGYIAAAELPIRENWQTKPPYLPLQGTGGSEWVDVVPDDQIARYENPKIGYVATANNDIYGTVTDNDATNDPYYYYWDVDIGYRAGRITDLLSAKQGHFNPNSLTLTDMKTIQFDNLSYVGQRLVPHLLSAADARPDLIYPTLQEALDRLAAWDFTTPASVTDKWHGAVFSDEVRSASIAACIFHIWLGKASLRIYGDDFKKANLDLPGDGSSSGPQMETKAMLWLLEHESSTSFSADWWDDQNTDVKETKEETLLNALTDTINYLNDNLGPDMTTWQWGRLHTLKLGLTFSGITIPSILSPVLGPAAADGGDFTVNVGNCYGLGDDYYDSHNPAARMVMNIDGERMESYAVLPGGQSERSDSEHYDDMFGKYLTGQYVPVLYKVEEIIPVTVERIQFTPMN